MDKKHIFMTGITGFIGRALCAKMIEKEWRVRGVVRPASNLHNMPAGIEYLTADSIETHQFSNSDFSGIDAVIHLAARVHDQNRQTPESLDRCRKINLTGTERLAQAAANAGVKRFVFISSVKVNGQESDSPYNEYTLPSPQDAYGASKHDAENVLVRIGEKTGIQIVILRLPLVYGPGVKANFKNLAQLIKSGLPLPFKNIRNRRSLIYLENLIDAILTCVIHPGAKNQTFMVSDGEDISTPDLIKMIAAAMNKRAVLFSLHPSILKILAAIFHKKADLQRLTGSLTVDTRKIQSLLGWKPPFSLTEGIQATFKTAHHDKTRF